MPLFCRTASYTVRMTKNPFINALCAGLYIVGIVYVLSFAERLADTPDTIFIPMAMLSLFVFSAAFMGYAFLYQPLSLFLEDKKQEAASFFIKTLLTFGAIMLALFALVVLVPTLLI